MYELLFCVIFSLSPRRFCLPKVEAPKVVEQAPASVKSEPVYQWQKRCNGRTCWYERVLVNPK